MLKLAEVADYHTWKMETFKSIMKLGMDSQFWFEPIRQKSYIIEKRIQKIKAVSSGVMKQNSVEMRTLSGVICAVKPCMHEINYVFRLFCSVEERGNQVNRINGTIEKIK